MIATGFDRAMLHLDEPIMPPIERKRATQIAMPYSGMPFAPRTPTQANAPVPAPRRDDAQVELKTQQAMRDQPMRADATPVTAPMRTEGPRVPDRSKVEPRLAAALSGAEETELDIPAFLRHPLRSVE